MTANELSQLFFFDPNSNWALTTVAIVATIGASTILLRYVVHLARRQISPMNDMTAKQLGITVVAYGEALGFGPLAAHHWWLVIPLAALLIFHLAVCRAVRRQGIRRQRKLIETTAGLGWLISLTLLARYLQDLPKSNSFLMNVHDMMVFGVVAFMLWSIVYALYVAWLWAHVGWRAYRRWRKQRTDRLADYV